MGNQIIKSNKWKYRHDCSVSWVSSVPLFRYKEDRNLLADFMNLAGKPSDETIWQTDLNSETASEWQLHGFLFNCYVIDLFISLNVIFTPQKNHHLFLVWSVLHSTLASTVTAVILTIRTSLSEEFLIQGTTTATRCMRHPVVFMCAENHQLHQGYSLTYL